MLIKDLLRKALGRTGVGFQFIHECVLGVKVVKAKNGTPAHSRVEFATDIFQPRDAMFPSDGAYIGVIIWIPRDEYLKLEQGRKAGE